MFITKYSGATTFMIYLGTFLLSVLSFFTTYYGMSIVLNQNLALVGSLGLQIVMLGIAWSLIKVRNKRSPYIIAFIFTGSFSMFFSFVNFDTALQERTRAGAVRGDYAVAVRNVMSEYSNISKQGLLKGRYQVSRLEKLLEMEEQKGWATVVDEGSRDEYIQNIIEGARQTIKSWESSQGEQYSQGQGRGIIVNYLESHLTQSITNLDAVEKYAVLIDSLNLTLNSNLTVKEQYDLANLAWTKFPLNEVAVLISGKPSIPTPPNQTQFVEKAATSQETLKLVIADLLELNHLALFALLLAISIDMIIIVMAFAGSHLADGVEDIFDRLKMEAGKRMDEIPLDDPDQLSEVLQKDVEKFRRASEYGLDVSRVLWEYRNAEKKLRSGGQNSGEDVGNGKKKVKQLEEF